MSSALRIERIDDRKEGARDALVRLRERLSIRGDIVSEAGRARTIAAFGEPLSPQAVVERICREVRAGGLDAALELTRRLDGKSLSRAEVRVSATEMSRAAREVDPVYLEVVRTVRDRIAAFQRSILHRDVPHRDPPGIELGVRYRPLARVGVCVPGGAAAYPSSLLMTVVPAQTAGVAEIVVMVPPTSFGGYNSHVLAACHELGLEHVFRIGGAQAIAALAYGVEGIERVDKIVGPGNLFVALAKKHVFGDVGIDSIAGPSEVVVVADETARADFLAADLISQAEHAPGSSVFVTWHAPLIDEVLRELTRQLSELDRGDLARESLERFGLLVLVEDEDAAVSIAEFLAPEHLHLSVAFPEALGERIRSAGAIFLGHFAPVAAGDYAAGPSHVLPTGATARWMGGLSANDFLKSTSMIHMDREGLQRLSHEIGVLAGVETLTAHRASVDIRLEGTHSKGRNHG